VIGAAILIAIAVLVVVVISVWPRDSRPDTDAAFLSTVQPIFPGVKDAALMKLGHDICATFDRYPSDPSKAEYAIAKAAISQPDMPADRMVALIRASVRSYCPSYQAAVNQGQETTTSL